MRSKHCYDICPPSLTDISFGKMMTVQFTWCKGSGSLSVPPAAGRAQGSQPVTQGRSPALLHLPLCGHSVVTYMKGMTNGSFWSSLNTKAVQYKIPKQTSSLHGLITPKAVKFVYSKNVLLFYVPNFHGHVFSLLFMLELPYSYLISWFLRDSISRGFIFATSIGSYQKRTINFAIQAFSTSFNVSKKWNLFIFRINWNNQMKMKDRRGLYSIC